VLALGVMSRLPGLKDEPTFYLPRRNLEDFTHVIQSAREWRADRYHVSPQFASWISSGLECCSRFDWTCVAADRRKSARRTLGSECRNPSPGLGQTWILTVGEGCHSRGKWPIAGPIDGR
jgi:hypothetical protein